MPLASRSADRLSGSSDGSTVAIRFTRASSTRQASIPATLSFPRDLSRLPLTTKQELVADQQASPPWGTNLTEPLEQYTRYNQTSSTTGSAAALARYQRELAVDARVLEGGVCAARRWMRAIAFSFRFRSGRFSASGRRSRRAARSARTAFRPAACRARRVWR